MVRRPYYTVVRVWACIYVDKAGLVDVIKLKTRGKTFGVILSTRALSRGSSVTSNCGWENLSPIPQLRNAVDLIIIFATSCLYSIHM